MEKEKIIYTKNDIMELFQCESDKALRFMRFLYSIRVAIKIGREYYVTKESLLEFLEDMQGKSIPI